MTLRPPIGVPADPPAPLLLLLLLPPAPAPALRQSASHAKNLQRTSSFSGHVQNSLPLLAPSLRTVIDTHGAAWPEHTGPVSRSSALAAFCADAIADAEVPTPGRRAGTLETGAVDDVACLAGADTDAVEEEVKGVLVVVADALPVGIDDDEGRALTLTENCAAPGAGAACGLTDGGMTRNGAAADDTIPLLGCGSEVVAPAGACTGGSESHASHTGWLSELSKVHLLHFQWAVVTIGREGVGSGIEAD